MDNLEYRYHFEFSDGREETFQLSLDMQTLAPGQVTASEQPEWTRLENNKCSHCPLTNETSHCPLAVQLAPLVDKLKDVKSIEDTKVSVEFDERITSKETAAQDGISSIMGIIVAISGCPLTDFFKPMARFHLPFSSMEETFYRAASMYMLGQYYRWQNDLSIDMDMKGIHQVYDNMAIINKGMADRLRTNQREDGAVNALVLLDMFVKSVPDAIDDLLDELKPLFEPYLRS